MLLQVSESLRTEFGGFAVGLGNQHKLPAPVPPNENAVVAVKQQLRVCASIFLGYPSPSIAHLTTLAVG